MTPCDVNSKASLQNKIHRVPQSASTLVSVEVLHVNEEVQGGLLGSASWRDDCHSRLAINIC